MADKWDQYAVDAPASKWDAYAVKDPAAAKKAGIRDPGSQPSQRNAGQRVADYTTDMLSNVPGSAARLAGNIGNAVIHPIDTAENLGKVVTGTMQNMTPGYVTPERPGYSKEADAAWDALKERYGSPEAFMETLRTDPVGVASDVSAVVGGVSGLAKGTAALADATGRLPNIANAARSTANAAATVSDAVNPLNLITKPAGYVAKATGKACASRCIANSVRSPSRANLPWPWRSERDCGESPARGRSIPSGCC